MRALMHIPLSLNYRKNCRLQTPTEESPTRRNHQLQAPTGKDVHCVSYMKSNTPAIQPARNHHYPKLSLSLMDFHSKQPLPMPSFFPIK